MVRAKAQLTGLTQFEKIVSDADVKKHLLLYFYTSLKKNITI